MAPRDALEQKRCKRNGLCIRCGIRRIAKRSKSRCLRCLTYAKGWASKGT